MKQASVATAAVLLVSCAAPAPSGPSVTPPPAPAVMAGTASPAAPVVAASSRALPANTEGPVAVVAAPRCTPADWTPRKLPPLLEPGLRASAVRDQTGASQLVFDAECSDSPGGAEAKSPPVVVVDGVELRIAGATAAGKSGRGWAGNQCSFDLRLADGSGPTVHLGAQEVPPFTTVSALVRKGSAVWLSVTFNGYTREFPKGGNRVVAVDLCAGRVVWQSKNATSNGGLLLLDDYLVSPYGFTTEPRFVHVLHARSGAPLQKLPVVETVCPSTSWAPNYKPGDRCDAPGQRVGAATNPRVEGGVFLVDTNTGSATFQFR